MGEFYRAFLTGGRAAKGKRYRVFRLASSFGEFLLAFLALLLPLAGVGIPPAWDWVLLGGEIVFAASSVLLGFLFRRVMDDLVEEEYAAAEAECTGEARERYARLYRSYCETQPKRLLRILALLPNLLVAIVFTGALVGATVLNMFEGALPELAVWIVVGVVLLSALCAILQTMLGIRRENAFYDRAGKDLDVLKRERGIRTATTRNSLPEPICAFLKEESDLRELTERLRRQSMIAGAAVAAAFILTPILSLAIMSPKAVPIIFGVAAVLLVSSFMTCAILGEITKRAMYRRNRAKLTDSEIDRVRGALQTAWESVQRRGNLIFLCFLLAGFVVGGTLGTLSLAGGSGIGAFFGCIGGSMFLMAILSVFAWCIFSAATKRNLKELQSEIARLRDAEPFEERT